MITKEELEKMVEEKASEHYCCNEEWYRESTDKEISDGSFKHGASLVTGILMSEIERLNEDFERYDFRHHYLDEALKVDRLKSKLYETKTKIEELEKDRARLEWMIENHECIVINDQHGTFGIFNRVNGNVLSHFKKTPRDAIDACIRENEK